MSQVPQPQWEHPHDTQQQQQQQQNLATPPPHPSQQQQQNQQQQQQNNNNTAQQQPVLGVPVPEFQKQQENKNTAASSLTISPAEPAEAPPVDWSRDQDDKLRKLRQHLEKTGSLPSGVAEAEYLALEKQYDLFEKEGMKRLMQGQTPQQRHDAELAASFSSSSSSPTAGTTSSSSSSSDSSPFRSALSGLEAAGSWISSKIPDKESFEKGAKDAYKKGFFWTSLVATAAPALGKKMGLTEGFDHWNFVIPYSKNNNHGPLILGALPVMTNVMGSGNHLQLLHQQLRDLKMTTAEPLVGMVVSALHKEEMEGFGSDLIKFATHKDWKNEFGDEIKTVLVPADDCSAGFFGAGATCEHGEAYVPMMNLLSEMNTALVSGKTVYVHCAKGKGRSFLVVVLFLIVFRGMTVEQAHAHIKLCRHQVSPSSSQLEFAKSFYKLFMENEKRHEEERKIAAAQREKHAAQMLQEQQDQEAKKKNQQLEQQKEEEEEGDNKKKQQQQEEEEEEEHHQSPPAAFMSSGVLSDEVKKDDENQEDNKKTSQETLDALFST